MKKFAELGIPNRLKKLGQNLNKDIKLYYKKLNIEFDPKWFAICQYLNEKGPAPINEIATAVNLTHPAIIQFVNEMTVKNIVKTALDSEDKRKRIISLTVEGAEIFSSNAQAFQDIEQSIIKLSQSIGYDIVQFTNSIEKAFQSKKFYDMVIEQNKKRLLNAVEILRYSPRYKEDFKNLNYEWLNKYFTVEDEDARILSNPEEVIISKGGEIFFARINNEIVGTCAAIKVDKNTYELAKMAVNEKAQGKQAGKKLTLAVVGFAYSKGAKAIILDTSSKLNSAISLYESIGFKNIPGESNSKYSRKTFRMRLDLK